ncbi:phosphatase PAP2 family protein [Leptolyngbya sp. AN02str]|uniref:phosphatase PAP2 family protein n=1 Tax=Leptolyngbya sp. AN02str TaxID=3423363 RepID=UPI003D31082E
MTSRFEKVAQKRGLDRPSLILLILGVLVPLQFFAVVALLVWQRVGGLAWDEPLLLAIHHTSTPQFDTAAIALTRLGSAWFVLPGVVIAAGLCAFARRWRSLLYLTLSLGGNALINQAGKAVWHRARPQLWDSAYPLPVDFSFPSGHAMTSMAVAATLVVLLWHSRWRWIAITLSTAYVIVVGWTRLYLGVHYPSDIVAGWMVAIAWSISLCWFIQPGRYLQPSSPPSQSSHLAIKA